MEDFFQKAWLVAGGHMTETPAAMTYAGIVSNETDSFALVIAALNDLDVKWGDVLNAYITTQIEEKVWITLGPEFCDDDGKRELVFCALYILKPAGAAFRDYLGIFMKVIGC